jgi:hypothetical protein
VLPNLLILGAQRCGTTSAYRYLSEHPAIFMSPRKEPHFLAFEGAPPAFTGPGDHHLNERAVTDLADYEALFAKAGDATLRGEASAMYLTLPAAIEGIRRHLHEPRFLVFVRQPADRAHSAHQYLRRQEREPLARFEDALAVEEQRRAEGWAPMWHYRAASHYAERIEAFHTAFGRERLLVVLQEDMDADPSAVFRSVFEWLGVDPDAPIDFELQHNRSGTPKSQTLDRALLRPPTALKRLRDALPAPVKRRVQQSVNRLRERNIVVAPDDLEPALRRRLTAELEPEIARLEVLIDRDLQAWRRPAR